MRAFLTAGFLIVLTACDQKPVEQQAAKPDWEIRYEKARREADSAFAANQLPKAAEQFRVASEALPANDARREECTQKIATCRFLEMRERGLQLFTAGKTSEAILAFEEAIKALPAGDPRISEAQEKLKGLRFQVKTKAAREKMEAQSWLDAVKEFEAARDFASPDQKEELNGLVAFSKMFAEADEAFVAKKDYTRAASLYEDLLKNPRGFSTQISEKLAAVRAQMNLAAESSKSEKEARFKQSFMEAEKYFAQAEWAKAKGALDLAAATGISSSEFEVLSKKILAAANPPEGFVYVAAGKFPFGTGPAEQVTGPQQEVQTDALYISKFEVTCGEYRKFLEASKDHSKCHPEEPEGKKQLGHVPENWSDAADPAKSVVGVDWFDAWSYSRWAGGRLPTEVEWEKAAGWDPKTGKRHVYPWGDDFVTGKGGASPCGAESMGGGVLEWIEDWYQPYPGGKAADLDFGQKRRVARGGVFLQDEEVEDCKVTRRFRFLPDRRDRKIGFRIVKATP